MKLTSILTAMFVLAALISATPAVAGTVTYTYDDAGRLIEADYDGGKSITYTYDNAGNLLQQVTTVSSADTTPDPFTFTEQADVPINTPRTSNQITVSGINAAAPISLGACTSALCQYSINGGAYTSAAGTVNNGQTVAVCQTSSPNFSTTTDLTLDIGGVTDTFRVTTINQTIDGPDLAGRWTQLSSQSGGAYVSGSLRVKNMGNRAAGSFKVSFFLSNDGNTLKKRLQTVTVEGLRAGRTRDLSFWNTSTKSLSGKYIIAVIDSAGQVAETDENNNRAAGRIP